MGFELTFHLEAITEHKESFAWYEDKQTGLGYRFIEEVDDILKRIQKTPEIYPKKKGSFREAVVNVFPYTIVYQIFPKLRLIHISAIHHGSRDPKTKYRKKV